MRLIPGYSRSLVASGVWFLAQILPGASAQAQVARVQLGNHVPLQSIKASQNLGRMGANETVSLSVPLKMRDPAGLAELIRRQATPGDADYGKYLTPAQFTTLYAPTQSDVDAVTAELQSEGFTITKVHENRMLIEVTGSVSQTENALGVEFHRYRAPDGRNVRASVKNPAVAASIAPLIEGIVGLDSFSKVMSHAGRLRKATAPQPNFGSGPSGGMMPADFKKAYGLDGVSLTGSGQTIALFEFDGFISTDITAYAKAAGITAPTISTVLLAGFNGKASTPSQSNQDPGSIEVELDMEVAMGMMPGASKMIVYESGEGTTEASFESDWLAMWQRIASDDSASVISCSWYFATLEAQLSSATINSENSILMQLASQGQSVFAATGDSGAYFSSAATSVSVADPGDQPYLTSVGGTALTVNSDGSYASESSWNDPATSSSSMSGGGGGISSTWAIPSWQMGLGNSANLGSSTKRMAPDVSLAADPNTAYAIYYNGSWYEVGGTSASSPLWAAFTGLVNQQRAASGLGNVGFLNPWVYAIANSSLYSTTFNDIADGSTNFKYPAVTGFDLTTGWGSFKGPALLSALSNSTVPPSAPSGLTVVSSGVGQ